MTDRKGIPQKIRFEVFKRDSFKCQYCGRSAPDVTLVVDHITPVYKDGDNDIVNLVTSCFDCNSGKGGRELSDDTVIEKRKKQLDDLQERREQIEMMVEWQRSLIGIEGMSAAAAAKFWDEMTPGWSLNENGIENIKKIVKRFGLEETLESMRICEKQYLRDSKGNITQATINKAFDYIQKVASSRKTLQKKPYMNDIYYIRGIMKNKGFYIGYNATEYMESAYNLGVSIDDLKQLALDARNWTDWRQSIEAVIEKAKSNG